MPHRNDIDGLRAIAVLSVVLFHLGFSEHIAGGFVGVDVFFVISGYLITGILQTEVAANRLRLAEFYNRRVRRIFPALFVVQLFCLIASAILLYPAEAKDVGRDVLWSLAFLSNVAFAHAGGYFDQASRVAPLLHTWSLSVEEQFYLGLPLLLLALARVRPRMRIGILAGLMVVSFAVCEWMVGVDARHAFYLVQYRSWELLLGSLLALGALPRVKHRVIAEVLALAGIAAILAAVLAIKGNTPFPGFWAIPPCLGAASVLYSGQEMRTITGRVLGSLPLRFIGLISYSLYLWHWPVIAIYNARHDAMPMSHRWAILGATFVVATLSYRFIERPFRHKPYRLNAARTLRLAGAAMAVVGAFAVGIPVAAARLHPASELQDAALSYLKYDAQIHEGTCFLDSGFNDVSLFRKDLCLKIVPKRKNYLIMGDSHAAHFVPAIEATHPEINLLQATASGCEPARGDAGAKRCTQLFAYVFDEFLPAHHVDALILSGRWPQSSLVALEKTIPYLHPFADRVIVLGPIVEYDQPFPQLLARSIANQEPGLLERHRIAKQRTLDQLYARRVAALSGAEYYSVYEATCPNESCTVWASPGVPMQYDEHHLTLRGAELVLERLGPSLFR